MVMAIHLIPDDAPKIDCKKTKTIPFGNLYDYSLLLILYGYFKSAEQVLPSISILKIKKH